MSIDGNDDERSWSSQQCPKSRRDRLFAILPRPILTTVYAKTELFSRRSESRSNLNVESQRDYNYNPDSPMNPNLEIKVTLLSSHNCNWQSIWCRSHRRSNQFLLRGIAMQWFHQSSNGSVQTGTVQSSPGPVQEILWTRIGPIPDADRLDWAWSGPIPHGVQG